MKARVKPLLETGVRVQEIARRVGLYKSTDYQSRADLLAAEAPEVDPESRKWPT